MAPEIFTGYGSSLHQHFKFNVGSEYKLLLRLCEPESDEKWLIEPFLQSEKDQSLLIPLSEVWNKGLLHSLAIKNLSTAKKFSVFIKMNPGPFNLSPKDAEIFITQDAPLLLAQNFAVQIPKKFGKVQPLRIVASLPQTRKGVTEGFLNFEYRVAVGESVLSIKEFLAIASVKRRLVRVKEKWVEINPDDAARLLKLLENRGSSIRDVALPGADAATQGFDIEAVEKNISYNSVAELLASHVSPAKEPDGFTGSLRHYQSLGIGWLCYLRDAGYGALLADDMGLGKTVQVIAYLLTNKKIKKHNSSLIICPTSVIGNWVAELAKFAPKLNVKVHHGNDRCDFKAFTKELSDADVILTSYALAWRDHEALCATNWQSIILDEAQNIKNPITKQSKYVKIINASHKIALTGTPIENRLSDLWSIMDFLNPGLFPCWKDFQDNFAKPIEEEGDSRMASLLKSAVGPFMLRRLKVDKGICDELPAKTESIEWCALKEEQATLYQAVVDETLQAIKDNDASRMAILASITKLKQICNHPSNFLKDTKSLGDRSGKVERLRDIAKKIIENHESCVIFTQFAEMASLLSDDIRKHVHDNVGLIHGGLSRTDRDTLVSWLQKLDSTGILVCSLKAGGVGLNLIAANHVIHFDRWGNPAVENQASDRAYRIGQKKDVFAHKFITLGTIEEKIDQMIERKVALSDSIIGKGNLDKKALREFFSLKK